MNRMPEWGGYGVNVEGYWEAVTFGDWREAAIFAKEAALSCPCNEEVPMWLERQRAAHQKTLSPIRQFFGGLLVRRMG